MGSADGGLLQESIQLGFCNEPGTKPLNHRQFSGPHTWADRGCRNTRHLRHLLDPERDSRRLFRLIFHFLLLNPVDFRRVKWNFGRILQICKTLKYSDLWWNRCIFGELCSSREVDRLHFGQRAKHTATNRTKIVPIFFSSGCKPGEYPVFCYSVSRPQGNQG